jgi:CheY-like chemotaxis protein
VKSLPATGALHGCAILMNSVKNLEFTRSSNRLGAYFRWFARFHVAGSPPACVNLCLPCFTGAAVKALPVQDFTYSRISMTPEAAITATTILVIEDYSDTREMLSVLLRKRGYNVVEAENGLEGISKAERNDPDLILMDLALPELDGIEVARRIREIPKLSLVPIFVLSAYLTEDVEADVRAVGCLEMFGKPFDFESLLESINITLGTSDVVASP